MTPKEKAEQHYQNAMAARKKSDAENCLEEISRALDVENKPEYFFERAWAQIRLAEFEDAETSLKMIATVNAARPSVAIVPEEVDALYKDLKTSQAQFKKIKTAFNKAVREKKPAEMLSVVTGKPAEEMQKLVLPSVRFKTGGGKVSSGSTKIGGNPDLASGTAWPRDSKNNALSFLCQIKLHDLTGEEADKNKLLAFFYDSEGDELNGADRDNSRWRVLLTPSTDARSTQPPADIRDNCVFTEEPWQSVSEQTVPDWGKLSDIGVVSQAVGEFYQEHLSKWYGKEPYHRHGGHPQHVQGEMEPELDEILGADTDNPWKLLLQLDTDNDVDMCWFDGGRLYFWIRECDFTERNFEKVWLIVQSY